ncbi:MAG: hypothetical protein GX446_19470 [Chthonomonadales bacterium]|nr:hypothetical protein [Chthonomonadales bacterium]
MGTAYTPGLKVSSSTVIEKTRRLPLKGTVLVKVGDRVEPDTIVARTELPGPMQTVKLAEQMGVEPAEVKAALKVSVGDTVEKGTLLAQTKGLFGWFKSEFRSPVAGKIEMLSEQTGHLGIRMPPTPVEKDAYIRGTVKEVIPEEGVVVQCRGALVQGIFGVGGERQGRIAVAVDSPDAVLTDTVITAEHAGCIVVGGSNVTARALRKAAEVGAAAIVVGGIVDRDLIEYLRETLKDPSFDIGVAITGHEPVPFTIVVTEGFGTIRMAGRTFDLLRSLGGASASVNGATQIRAGVIRPEVIAPSETDEAIRVDAPESGQLLEGTHIRVIREPYFGELGVVTALPPELQQVDSETHVRVLHARLEDGRDVVVPRANVEIIEAA